jgi:hypothetical protein
MTTGEGTPSGHDWGSLHASIAHRGVLINVVAPFFLLAIGYTLRRFAGLGTEPAFDEGTHKMISYVLGALAIGELAAGFFIRRSNLRPSRLGPSAPSFAAFGRHCLNALTVVFILGAFPSIYGLALYAVGGTIEQFVFFILVSLVGYRLLRPSLEDLEKLWASVTGQPEK